ncbi:MAG: tetratricopeptide repeat protein, partial [Ferruginibacter sp.]
MKFVFILISHLLFFISLEGQCPDRDFLWHRIIFLRDSSSVSPKDQLEELLQYEKEIKKCSYKNDSTHTMLLQRIGWLYTTQNDFLNAIKFTQNSIGIIDKNKQSSGINEATAIKSYWNLYLIYNSLKIESKEIMACDSCITRVIRLNTGYEYALEAIKFIVPVFFSNGDYYRCIKYAQLGESIFSKSGNALPAQEENSFIFFVWKINSLLSLNKTVEAAAALTAKIKAIGHKTDKSTLGTLYGLYATTQQREGKPNEAIKYFKRSFFYHKEIRFNEGCAEALNNIGYTYATLLHQEKTAKDFYKQALTYADENEEALNILDNIANLYIQTGNYDSAFYFFKKASNLLQPGFVETGLLKKDNTFPDGKMTEYMTGMLLDKAAAFLDKYKTTGDNNSVEEAIKIYKAIDSYFDKVKISQYDIQSKLFWKTNNKRLY